MTTISNEEILLNSDDNSITLTSHRIIHKTKDVTQEIFLKDVLGHEIIYKRVQTVLVLAIFVGGLAFWAIYYIMNELHKEPGSQEILLLLLSIVLLACYFKFQKKYLKIIGRYNSIEFSIKNLSEKSLLNFTNKISTLSDKLKTEN